MFSLHLLILKSSVTLLLQQGQDDPSMCCPICAVPHVCPLTISKVCFTVACRVPSSPFCKLLMIFVSSPTPQAKLLWSEACRNHRMGCVHETQSLDQAKSPPQLCLSRPVCGLCAVGLPVFPVCPHLESSMFSESVIVSVSF